MISVFVFKSLSASGETKSAVGCVLSLLSKYLICFVTDFNSPSTIAVNVMLARPALFFVTDTFLPSNVTSASGDVTLISVAFFGYEMYPATVSPTFAIVFANTNAISLSFLLSPIFILPSSYTVNVYVVVLVLPASSPATTFTS